MRRLAESMAQCALLIQSIFVGYVGYGHLFKPQGNLQALGFTFKPRWEAEERTLLMRHLCAVLGAAHLGRSATGILAGVWGGVAVLCSLFGEIVFLLGTIYAYDNFPAGTGAKGSPKLGPLNVMYGLFIMCCSGFVAGIVGYVWRPPGHLRNVMC